MALKERTFDRAKLAKTYLAGGMAPYQAARKMGFKRVGDMEEAIRAMEAEKSKVDTAEAAPAHVSPAMQPAGADKPAWTKPAGSAADTADETRPWKPAYKVDAVVGDKTFRVERRKYDEGEKMLLLRNGNPQNMAFEDMEQLDRVVKLLITFRMLVEEEKEHV